MMNLFKKNKSSSALDLHELSISLHKHGEIVGSFIRNSEFDAQKLAGIRDKLFAISSEIDTIISESNF